MRSETRRLRLLATVLAVALASGQALSLAHGLMPDGASAAHVEAEGATHDAAAHVHGCGLCRNVVSKTVLALRAELLPEDSHGVRAQPRWAGTRAIELDDTSVALPRGPPVG